MADPNQKLFSQIADLGRNINSLSDAIKKNTSATESFISSVEKSEKKEKDAATTANKTATQVPATQSENEKNDKSIKDLTKAIGTLLGDNSPLMSAIKSKNDPNKEGPGINKDFTNIAGGLKGIIKAFQEGGVAKKEGKYLVGENGPEVVKLPKGAGVIPINVKDLMEGLKNVPELSGLIKNSKDDTLNFLGNSSNPSLIDPEGMIMNLKSLSTKYQDLGNGAKDDSTRESADKMTETIDSLISLGRNGIDKEVLKIGKESQLLSSKYKLDEHDLIKRDMLLGEILNNAIKENDHYKNNPLAVYKAKLLATQSLVNSANKENSEFPSGSTESEIRETYSKLSSADTKQQMDFLREEIKKSEGVVNPNLAGKENKGSFPKISIKKEGVTEESVGENKKSALLSKVGKGAESALFSLASSATGNLGVASPLAKKGLGSLKKSLDNRENSKGEQNKSELFKAATPSLVSDVKKLSNTPKKEPSKEATTSPEAKPSDLGAKSQSASKDSDKQESTKKSEIKGPNTSELGTPKDIQDIKNALSRIAAILEGPLTVSPMESPFRPDSRRI